jgi:hypothetical protein
LISTDMLIGALQMSRFSLFGPLFLVAAASACATQSTLPTVTLDLPEADLSTDSVDFGDVAWGDTGSRQIVLTNAGDLPMGIESIGVLDDGMEDSFVVAWNPASIVCPDADNTEEARTGGAVDTWDDPGPGDDGTDPAPEEVDDVVILDPGCTLTINAGFSPASVGMIHGSIEVLTTSEQDYEDDPSYHRDPDGFRKVILLAGNGIKGAGNIVVRSPTMDMGHHYTGESHTEYLFVHNVGDGDLLISEPTFADDCHDSFSVGMDSFDEDRILTAGDATYMEIYFEPTDLDPAYCTMIINSDDEDSPEVDVNIQGNAGYDPENEAPTIEIHSPGVGYVHNSSEPLTLELDMFDVNQPATTLYCKVKSLVGEAKVADCVPSDKSGHIFVEIDVELLEEGTDTLLVTVTDQSELYSYASTTVLWASTHPDDDDDGDGWGDTESDDEEANVDCDDTNATVYPSAAEIYDGLDNDCDGAIDENTLGNDDDGDTVSEIDGDCDDTDSATYPEAPEQSDLKDNDCDGEVDEGTSLYDDDGDGFAEVDNDCNDADPEVNPAATEVCDGIDNDCNGYKDHQEGCVEIDSEPMIIGGVRMAQTAIGVGESTTMSVLVYDADGQDVSYTWQEDNDLTAVSHTAISTPTAQTTTWTAPDELPSGADGAVFSVYVIVQDEDGNQDWAFDEIWVYRDPVATTIDRIVLDTDSTAGCTSTPTTVASSSDTASAVLFPLIPLLGIAFWRRRRN